MSDKVFRLNKIKRRPKSKSLGGCDEKIDNDADVELKKFKVQQLPEQLQELTKNQQQEQDQKQQFDDTMHTFGDVNAAVPAFLAKLWRLVDDPETNNLICWSKDGRSFIIQNQAQFARELLPLNYKHNNMASFIRQLNMYGFHKITSIDNGGLKFDRDEMEFSHPCFKRNCLYLLEHIKRKISNTKNVDEKSTVKQEAVSKVLQDVKAMRGRQDSLDSRFSVMKQENEALWREIASLRQKHAKQQQIVNKLIQFLITIVSPSRNMSGVKRHMQLMIHDTPESSKMRKTSETESELSGPVIHEMSEELLDEVADTVGAFMNPNSPYDQLGGIQYDNDCTSPQTMERPRSAISVHSQNYEYSNQSVDDLCNVAAGNGNGNGGQTFAGGGNFTGIVSGNGSIQTAATKPAVVSSGGAGTGTGVALGNNNIPDVIMLSNGATANVATGASGQQVIYHVSEVPDAHTTEVPLSPYNDDNNVLTTPMVREQEARSRLLKEKNKQRASASPGGSGDGDNDVIDVSTPTKVQRMLRKQAKQDQPLPKPIQVKTEPDMDPLLYLNPYWDTAFLSAGAKDIRGNGGTNGDSVAVASATAATADTNLISPNSQITGEESRQSAGNLNTELSSALVNPSTNADLYNANFISDDIPTELFEDANTLLNEDTSESAYKLNQKQQFGLNTVSKGKFARAVPSTTTTIGNNGSNSILVGNGNNSVLASSSKAIPLSTGKTAAGTLPDANLASTSKGVSGPAMKTLSQQQQQQGKNIDNMTVAKYNSNSNDGTGGTHLRLSSVSHEVNDHLDNVQDELDTLKDLLRGENYSIDQNMLMGLVGARRLDARPYNGTALAISSSNFNNNSNDFGKQISDAVEADLMQKLFNDTDLLDTYGLSFPSDSMSEKNKGSELMAYQPMYDLSDMINDNKNSESNNSSNDGASISNVALAGPSISGNGSSSSRQLQSQNSVLNTPYHE